jgi:hypothetical protein
MIIMDEDQGRRLSRSDEELDESMMRQAARIRLN